ncbi:MAG: hydrogenase maturation nickel metallochaperone HypA [Candidatus Heimdallarchaeota archaeon]|nr:MAG: hydrogenase maturation nickel metallochaperone HypA [Candidatus Heimdallarchaeota archaeon]
MHEFSLAQSVLETTMSIAQERSVERIRKVILKFGIFALVQEDQFRFCFDLIKADSDLTAKSELEIIWTPGELECESCTFEGKIEDFSQEHNELAPFFQCPNCKSYSTRIISGTETIIDSIIV